MSKYKWNVIANYVGNFWVIGLTFATIPLVIAKLGIEAYGVVGFSATLFAVLSLLDVGLGAAMSRSAAQLDHADSQALSRFRNLSRSMELIYWAIGILVALILLFSAPWIASHWLNNNHLPHEQLVHSIQVMGLIFVIRWPMALYFAGLIGFERQVTVNQFKMAFETVRALVSLAVIYFYQATLTAYFVSQALSILVFLPMIAILFWKVVPGAGTSARFDLQSIYGLRAYASGVAGISIISAILIQMDKMVASAMLDLKHFGYYSLASSAALVIYHFANPVAVAVFPRFNKLLKSGAKDMLELKAAYHQSAKLVSFMVFPPAIIVVLFHRELLLLWTGSTEISAGAGMVLAILTIGNTLNSLMIIPYQMQLAHGWVGLALKMNVVSVLLLPLLVYWGVEHYGGLGAALGWVALNIFYGLTNILLMHKKILPGEKQRWLTQDIAPIVFMVLAMAALLWLLKPLFMNNNYFMMAYIAFSYGALVFAAAMAIKNIRQKIRQYLHKFLSIL